MTVWQIGTSLRAAHATQPGPTVDLRRVERVRSEEFRFNVDRKLSQTAAQRMARYEDRQIGAFLRLQSGHEVRHLIPDVLELAGTDVERHGDVGASVRHDLPFVVLAVPRKTIMACIARLGTFPAYYRLTNVS